MVARMVPVSFQALPGWDADNLLDVIDGLVACAGYVREVKPYKTGAFGLQWSDFAAPMEALEKQKPTSPEQARHFFEDNFIPLSIQPQGNDKGFVTAYYEPEIEVADRRTGDYQFPIHACPPDLIPLDEQNRPPEIEASFAFGRKSKDGIVEYADRRSIEQGFLDGRGLEIAWAKDRVDLFFVHIQGAARLRYPDGTIRRMTYAAKSGHPFTAIGRVLIDLGELQQETVSMQSIRAWLAQNPQRVNEILWHNRSYIFFRQADVEDPEAGPIAAAKVPLMPGRSLAVDRLLHTFGTPFYVQADDLTHINGAPFRRLMLAQDTGTAIVGPARGDIFIGSGAAAGEIAGMVKHDAAFFMLVPLQAAERLSQ
ncbi:MAG: murein transglycosylase A [Pseudomonadota bacterium]